jgi:hypothetical protein
VRILIAVQTEPDGRRLGRIQRFIRPGNHEACMNADIAAKQHYSIPTAAVRRGDDICVGVD